MNTTSLNTAGILTMFSRATAALLLCLAAGCGSGGGPMYFHATSGQASPESGTDCPGQGNDLNAYSGIDGSGDWVIYAAPNNQYLLEGALAGDLMIGTLVGSAYTFTGTITSSTTTMDGMGNNIVTTVITKVTINMTTSGPGFTGTYQSEVGCTSSDSLTCSPYSNDGKDSDCTSSGTIAGTQITGVQEQEGQGASAATPP